MLDHRAIPIRPICAEECSLVMTKTKRDYLPAQGPKTTASVLFGVVDISVLPTDVPTLCVQSRAFASHSKTSTFIPVYKMTCCALASYGENHAHFHIL